MIDCYATTGAAGTELEKEPYSYPNETIQARYCVVKKYEVMYAEHQHRFKSVTPPVYALPSPTISAAEARPYHGLGRDEITRCDQAKESLTGEQAQWLAKIESFEYDVARLCVQQSGARLCLSLYSQENAYEIIWARLYGSTAVAPGGYSFIGYDVSYYLESELFSLINDSMFICQWHGCDESGTELLPHFNRLNGDGLFATPADAERFVRQYVTFEWGEKGEFFITEIFRRP